MARCDAPESVLRWPFICGAESRRFRGRPLIDLFLENPSSILTCLEEARSAGLEDLRAPLCGDIADDTALRVSALALFLIDPLVGFCVCFECLPKSLSYAALVCLLSFAGCNSRGITFVLPDFRLPPSTKVVGPSAFGKFHGFGSSFFDGAASFRRFAGGPSL